MVGRLHPEQRGSRSPYTLQEPLETLFYSICVEIPSRKRRSSHSSKTTQESTHHEVQFLLDLHELGPIEVYATQRISNGIKASCTCVYLIYCIVKSQKTKMNSSQPRDRQLLTASILSRSGLLVQELYGIQPILRMLVGSRNDEERLRGCSKPAQGQSFLFCSRVESRTPGEILHKCSKYSTLLLFLQLNCIYRYDWAHWAR